MTMSDSIQTGIDPVRATEIRHRNIMAVLSAIYASRNKGGASQTDIVNRIGLKAPSVFRIFTYLEQNGYIVQCQDPKAIPESRKANGTSIISNIEQIDRGYENIEARLNALGAKIERIN